MPYSSNSELPKNVRDALPAAAQSVFRNVVNSALANDFTEERAFKQAWGAVKRSYHQNDEGEWIAKAAARTLYVRRNVKNSGDIISWAKAQGFDTTVPGSEMHVTLAFSRAKVDWMKVSETWSGKEDGGLDVRPGGPRVVEKLGDKGAIVLMFASHDLHWRHQQFKELGASWDWDSYQPHVTITYEGAPDLDITKIEPYRGKINLGPEIFEEVNENWTDTIIEKGVTIVKLDDEQQMVYGWASVTHESGTLYVDSQDDTIDSDELVKCTTEFMLEDDRISKAMHVGGAIGVVVHSMPLTAEIAKSFGITSAKHGWMVGIKVLDDEVWKLVKSGHYRAFSIGAEAEREAA
jgi:cation transport regulator ChaB